MTYPETLKEVSNLQINSHYDDVFDYDREHLITYKKYYGTPEENRQACHILFSKQDGSVTQEIPIPFKEMKTPVVMKDELVVTPEFHMTFPAKDHWVLVNTSSDTVYNYFAEGQSNSFYCQDSLHTIHGSRSLSFPNHYHRPLLFHADYEERIGL